MIVALLIWSFSATGQRTPILKVDLATGSSQSFDQSGPKTGADRELDALLDSATSPTFTSRDLESVATALSRFLRSSRPRAMPRMLLFLYPGRISRSGLKELREIKVEVDLVVDPCSRAACDSSLGTHLELLGRAMKQVVLRTRTYTVRFTSVILRRRLDLHGSDFEVLRFLPEEVVQAGLRPGGGQQLLSRQKSAAQGYEQAMVSQMSKKLRSRRIRVASPPQVGRSPGQVAVVLEIHSDRVRVRTHVIGALVAAAQALQTSPLTPARVDLMVTALVPMRRTQRRVFTCQGHALSLHLQGRLGEPELWSTYVMERKKEGTRLTFDDDEAASRARQEPDDAELGAERMGEILSAHIQELAPCLQQEASRSRSFRTVTLVFNVSSSGRATQLKLKERSVSGSLLSCLDRALGRIRFPAHSGPPRQVLYPMTIQR